VTASELNQQIGNMGARKGPIARSPKSPRSMPASSADLNSHLRKSMPANKGGSMRSRWPPVNTTGSPQPTPPRRPALSKDDMNKPKRLTMPDLGSHISRSTTMSALNETASSKPTPPKRPPKPGHVLNTSGEADDGSGGKWKRGAEAEAIMALLRAEASKVRPSARTVEVKAPAQASKSVSLEASGDKPPSSRPPVPPSAASRKTSAPPIPLKPTAPPIPQKPNLSVDASPKRSMKGISSTDVIPVTDTNTEGKWKRSAEAEALLSMLQAEASQDAIEELIKSKIEAEPPKPEVEVEKKATDPFQELLMTERNFVYDLDNVLNTFVKPLREKDVVSSSLADEFCLNFDCLADFHKHLYGQICRVSTVGNLVDSFNPEALIEMEKLYTVYMGNYERILALFYEKRESNAALRKFLKMREETSNKSVNNLLVTPMQRVCKYELMLASIVKMKQKAVKKGELEEGENADQVLADCEMLQARVEEIGTVLRNVDRRRQAADIWENIMKLEQSLLVSEPLAKVGRHIIRQADVPMKSFGTSSTTHGSVDTFKLVLFNDLLVRTKVPKKGKKGRVLDQFLPGSIQLIDASEMAAMANLNVVVSNAVGQTNSREVDIHKRLYVVDLDPRGSIFELHNPATTEKAEWLESLRGLAQSPAKFWEQWQIEEVSPDGHKEMLLAADSCEWAQAFVKQCRIFITSSHLCLLWKVYGRVERTKVPLSQITMTNKEKKSTTSKTGTIEVKTTTWKQNYRFTDVQNCDYTFAVLEDAISEYKASERLSLSSSARGDRRGRHAGPGAFSSLLMPLDDWAAIWEHAALQRFKKGDTVVTLGNANPMLFQVLSGTVKSDSSPPQFIHEDGLFGFQSFLQGTPSAKSFICDSADLQVRVFDRKSFSRHVKDPQVQARFFALLAFKQAA